MSPSRFTFSFAEWGAVVRGVPPPRGVGSLHRGAWGFLPAPLLVSPLTPRPCGMETRLVVLRASPASPAVPAGYHPAAELAPTLLGLPGLCLLIRGMGHPCPSLLGLRKVSAGREHPARLSCPGREGVTRAARCRLKGEPPSFLPESK